jgi:hypothetical protein
MSTIRLPYVTISFENPIVFYQYKEGSELGVPEMKELIACAEKLSWGRPYVTFSDVRVKMGVTNEGKRYIGDLDNLPFFRGTAALVGNSMLSFALNFMSSFEQKKYPFKAFTSRQKAMKWLQSLPLDQHNL